MRTANNRFSLTRVCLLSGAALMAVSALTLGGSSRSLAAEAAPLGIPLAAETTSLPPPPFAETQMTKAESGADVKRSLASTEEKISDGAKSLVKKLDNMNENTSLEDLNKARQAIARIDAMIEIEKRLAELDKVRSGRNSEKHGGSAAALASAIPASALAPLPSNNLSAAFKSPDSAKVRPVSTGLELSRIVGSEGRYTATFKGDGGSKTVRVGDKFNGGTVRSITAQSVTVEDGGETRTMRVKNVDAIFSAMR